MQTFHLLFGLKKKNKWMYFELLIFTLHRTDLDRESRYLVIRSLLSGKKHSKNAEASEVLFLFWNSQSVSNSSQTLKYSWKTLPLGFILYVK